MNQDKLLKSLNSLYEDMLELDAELEANKDELVKGPNYWKSRNPAKYKKMLAKLRRERKTPGSAERSYQQILQSRRRENGKSGTTAGEGRRGHATGHDTRKTSSAVKNYAKAEKKSKKKLSIDRINNKVGYKSSNTRLVPQELNNGDAERADKKKWVANHNKKKK